MTAAAIGRTTTDPANAAAKTGKLERLSAFALAGMAAFGVVLEEYDVTHDNRQGFVVLGSGVAVGLVAGALVGRRPACEATATRVAWDVVRFVLAYEMIRYGVPKLLGMQFYPQYFRWDKRLIDQTPMALAWAFLGRTYWYQAFGGVIEVASGILVCFRRTILLGACLMTTALLNVVLINYFYDVPVKLFASVYLLFDVALIAPHWRRLGAFFLAPVERAPTGRWGRWAYGLVVAFAIVAPAVKMTREALEHRVFQREPLEGPWTVDESSGAPADLDRIYFEKDDVGFLRVAKTLIPFQKELVADQLQLSVARDDALVHEKWMLRRLSAAGAENFPYVMRGAIVSQGRTVRFQGTCDDQPCTMKLTREWEFPR